jgi:N-methylhydantoinase A
MYRLAFDIGGTFTDFVLHDTREDTLRLWKVPTSSGAPADAVVKALHQLLEDGTVEPADIGAILHATTVATNAILERKGARTALITTRGFRDIALLGRQKRPDTNDMNLGKQRPVVARSDIIEVTERIEATGKVHTPLNSDDVEAAIARIREGGYEAVAVMFLHAYANPEHERAIGERLRAALPGVKVSLSCEVSPRYREYERVTTTTANAYVQPIVHRYLEQLESAFETAKLQSDFMIMQSNGGLVSPQIARAFPVRIVESGPAAGVLMCAQMGRDEKIDHLLTFDMGGTTAKLGAIDFGEPVVVPTFEVDTIRYRKGSGLPLNITAIELLEIGAGGGSIAEVAMGLIRVGPSSAGAIPGPICYGRGGTRATITDANLVLGYLNPDYFNGGAMTLDLEGARKGVEEQIAKPLGLTLEKAAWGIHSVANSNMERAMRVVSVERGRDPRTHVMIAFGGAGPLHATRLARALGVPRVMIPYGAGVGSALGLLTADQKIDNSITRVLPLDASSIKSVEAVFSELEARLNEELKLVKKTSGEVYWRRGCSMRYRGQGYELRVDLPDGPIDENFISAAQKAFEAAYEANYGYVDKNAKIEGIDWHLMAVIPSGQRAFIRARAEQAASGEYTPTWRRAYFPEVGGFVETPVISRYGMRVGQKVSGPVLIEERESTTIVLPGDVAHITESGHLMVDINAEKVA